MRTLSIDIETYSPVDLIKSGVYKYAEHPEFEVLMIAYSYDGEPVKIIDIRQDYMDADWYIEKYGPLAWKDYLQFMESFCEDLQNPEVLKTAFNAAFERTCLSAFFKINLPIEQWECTMVKGAMLGLPMSLAQVAEVLKLNVQKDMTGRQLIRYFSLPCKPTKANNERTRNLPEHSPEKWRQFLNYCVKDVEVELSIRNKLDFFTVPESEMRLWHLDQQINDYGVKINKRLVKNAIIIDEAYKARLIEEAKELTKLENPNSVSQVIRWLEYETGEEIQTLRKADVPDLMKKYSESHIQRMLEIRQELSKTSVKKYLAMAHCVCKDGRIRGLLQFYGAARTGRWCIAEGSLVLVKTDEGWIGKKPIEEVEITDQVFDGLQWVFHEGVVYSGEKFVIEHDGVTATPEHKVFVDPDMKISLGEAKRLNLPLWKGEAYREWHVSGVKPENPFFDTQFQISTYDIINAGPNNRFWCDGRIVSNSGRLVQVQNLPQNKIPDIDFARQLVLDGDAENLELAFGNVPDTLSQLIRTAFVAPKGKKLTVVDLSAIEARVIAWFAGEKWRLDVFNTHGKIYEASASQMFKVPIETIGKGSPLRQKGKVAELACIAKDELVLTHQGLVPIQDVTLAHKVWDGENWVSHGGVVYRGIRDIIHYGPLKATMDHIVWVDPYNSYSLIQVVVGNYDLLETGFDEVALYASSDIRKDCRFNGIETGVEVYDILNAGPNNRFTVSGVLVHNCGFGGGPNALINMGALKMGLQEAELKPLIDAWRAANQKIVNLWTLVEHAVISAVEGNPVRLSANFLKFYTKKGLLFIELPSGRTLAYLRPKLKPGKFGGSMLCYEGMDQTTKQWKLIDTYGGKLVENIVQATARDVIADIMKKVAAKGYQIIMSIHDEIVVECDEDNDGALEEIINIMREPLDWAPGLPLDAAGFETPYYMKD